jgi:uncharacterized protein with beta-barrel porin domain
MLGGDLYAALISPSGGVTPIPLGLTDNTITSVAINNSGNGLIGGRTSSNTGFAAFVSPSGTPTPIVTGTAFITSVGLNDSGSGIIGGSQPGLGPYAALVSLSQQAVVPVTLPAFVFGPINSVAINSSGQGIVGGTDIGGNVSYAAFISPSTNVTLITSNIIHGAITSVGINASGQGIIGGRTIGGPAYAATVSPAGVATPIPIAGGASGVIASVSINDAGYAIAGGALDAPSPPYAALISPSGGVTVITTGISRGVINSVAINAFGQSLIVGENTATGQAYAAIVSRAGVATWIPSSILYNNFLSVAILSRIPTDGLTKNNLEFARYINDNAPQDAFYFAPAFFDGTLAQALESAAPTRNAFSLYTAINNLFYLNNALSSHLRHSSHFQSRIPPNRPVNFALAPIAWRSDALIASMACEDTIQPQPDGTTQPYTLWFEGIGALSYQHGQKQTVPFNPSTGAAILGFDVILNPQSWVGGGAAYSYTHIHEKKDAGHSHINQESLFVYGSYQDSCVYFDGALWGGLFQIDQVRNIHMRGFAFKSTSHPSGGQLAPHAEFGGNAYRNSFTTINPFVMVDWVLAWQGRYKEKGNSPFNAAQKHHYSSMVRTELGGRFYETLSFDAWRLTFEEKVSYVYKKPFHIGIVNAFLVGAPGSFTVETLTTPQSLGVVEFEMIFEPTDKQYPYGSITYQGEFGSSSQSHQIRLELDWNF